MDVTNILIGTILSFARVSSFLFYIPFLNSKQIPTISKIAISLAISLPVANKMGKIQIHGTGDFVLQLIIQIVIGLTLAFVIETIFSAAKVAGGLYDIDMGFSMMQILDPGSNQQTTVLSDIFYTIFFLVFISLGGFNQLVTGISYSFQFTTPDFFLSHKSFLDMIVSMVSYMLTAAVQIALPFTASMFIVNFILLVIGKTAPQFNIFSNMFPIKIGLGFLFLYITLPYIGDVFNQMNSVLMDKYLEAMNQIFQK